MFRLLFFSLLHCHFLTESRYLVVVGLWLYWSPCICLSLNWVASSSNSNFYASGAHTVGRFLLRISMPSFHDLALVAEQFPVLYLATLTLLGLLVGSFLNVVIHRLPIMMERSWQQEYRDYFDESPDDNQPAAPERFNLMVPRSACPHCGHAITALENIPILSWLMLRGRCRGCQTRISARYPLVGVVSGIAGAAGVSSAASVGRVGFSGKSFGAGVGASAWSNSGISTV
jgi:hypothetical protein